MKTKDIRLDQLFEGEVGLLRSSALRAGGLSFRQINQMVETGQLEKLDRGLYRKPDSHYDERLDLSLRIPSGVFCLYSACMLHELSSFVPSEMHLAIPKKSRYVLPAYPPVVLYYWERVPQNIGISTFKLPEGEVLVYDAEKTVCDMFRFRRKVGPDLAGEVLRSYLRRPNRRLGTLMEYARQLRIERELSKVIALMI